MSAIAVFGYGSLVNPVSAAQTLGRPLGKNTHLASLRGWRRRWSEVRNNLTCEKTFARADDGSKPDWVLGLNLEPVVDHPAVNGLLIEISAAELERLDVREIRYQRVEVSAQIDSNSSWDVVITYVAKPANFAPEPPPGAVVLASYAATVEGAFADLGAEQLRRYRETTDPPPVEVVDGVLVRDRIPPGNPRRW